MSTHAEAVRAAKDAVVEAARALHVAHAELVAEQGISRPDGGAQEQALAVMCNAAYEASLDAVDALLALEAETCPTCGGAGVVEMHEDVRGRMTCPAGCERGRKVSR